MLQLQIESSAACHARCVFCEYPTMQRAKGFMDLDLSMKILDDAATIPQISVVTFTGLGEPLLDKKLEARIAHARKLRKDWRIDVFTSGTHLTHERAESLGDAGLSILYISLNAATREKRKAIMKLDDFDQVVEQARYAIKLGRYRVAVKAVMSKDLMSGEDVEAFRNMWGGDFNPMNPRGGHSFLHLEGNWAGGTWPMRAGAPPEACSRALGQIMVLWDGRVSLCCFDGEGKEILGDLRTQDIREVYNGPHALGIRTAHAEGRRAEVPICAGCTGI